MGFTYIGGTIGLDLLATVRDWEGQSEDLLATPRLFAEWAVDAKLVTRLPAMTDADLGAVRSFRQLGYRLVRAACAGDLAESADRHALNRMAAHSPLDYSLTASGRVEASGGLGQLLSSVARDLVALLGGPLLADLRQCDGDHCTRFFIDASRARNRRFCSDRICGNRAKVAAFRRRAIQGRDSGALS